MQKPKFAAMKRIARTTLPARPWGLEGKLDLVGLQLIINGMVSLVTTDVRNKALAPK